MSTLVPQGEPLPVQRCGDHPCEGSCEGKEPEDSSVQRLASAPAPSGPPMAPRQRMTTVATPYAQSVTEPVVQRVSVSCNKQADTDKVVAAIGAAKDLLGKALTARGDTQRVSDIAFLIFRTRNKAQIDGAFANLGKAAAAVSTHSYACQDGSSLTLGCGTEEFAVTNQFTGRVNICDLFFGLTAPRQTHTIVHEAMHFGAGLQLLRTSAKEIYLTDDCLAERVNTDADVASRLADADHHACFASLLASGVSRAPEAAKAKGDNLTIVQFTGRARIGILGTEHVAFSSESYLWTDEHGRQVNHEEPLPRQSRITKDEHLRLAAQGVTQVQVVATLNIVGAPPRVLTLKMALTLTPQPKPVPPPRPVSKDPPFDGHTTGTLLRVRTGPGLKFPTRRLIEHKGTPIVVREQLAGSVVEGNDRWDRIGDNGAEEWVSDHFVAFDGPHEDFIP